MRGLQRAGLMLRQVGAWRTSPQPTADSGGGTGDTGGVSHRCTQQTQHFFAMATLVSTRHNATANEIRYIVRSVEKISSGFHPRSARRDYNAKGVITETEVCTREIPCQNALSGPKSKPHPVKRRVRPASSFTSTLPSPRAGEGPGMGGMWCAPRVATCSLLFSGHLLHSAKKQIPMRKPGDYHDPPPP